MAALIVALGIGFFLLRPQERGFADPYARDNTGGLGSGKYRGVILWTELKHQALVMAPRPKPGQGREKEQNWTIPFDGVYWFFKYPDRKPPAGSYSLSGEPEKNVFRSSDSFPLEMEARQNFANPLEMSCCSRIELQISNADAFPGTVWLELVLSDLRLPGEPRQSLGRQLVRTARRSAGEAGHEALSYLMPENPRIPQFDSATVNFIRFTGHNFASAKIGIQEFTFVPRGR